MSLLGRVTDARTGVAIASPLSNLFNDVHEMHFAESAMPHIGKLLWDLGCQSSVCNIVRATRECWDNLALLRNDPDHWRNSYHHTMRRELRSFRGQRQLAAVLDEYLDEYHCTDQPLRLLPASFWPFVSYLLDNCMRAYPSNPILRKWQTLPRPDANDDNAAETKMYQTNGNMYPFRPRQRPRAYYEGLEQEKANACRHGFPSHRKRTGGIMSSFCSHQV